MDYREIFRAKLRAALEEFETYAGKEDPTATFLDAVTEAASDWATEHGNDRASEAVEAEREFTPFQ